MGYVSTHQKVQDSKGSNNHLDILTSAYSELYDKFVLRSGIPANTNSSAYEFYEQNFNKNKADEVIKNRFPNSAGSVIFVEPMLVLSKKYSLAHESNNLIVTLLRVKENTCIVEFSNGELKEVPIDFLKEFKNN